MMIEKRLPSNVIMPFGEGAYGSMVSPLCSTVTDTSDQVPTTPLTHVESCSFRHPGMGQRLHARASKRDCR